MTTKMLAGVGAVAAFVGLAFAIIGSAQAPPAGQTTSADFDLAAAEHGGRVEWATAHYPPEGAAMNLIATTPYSGWMGQGGQPPHELVFSFFSRQSALVASVLVNPMTRQNSDRPKDVEVWTSVQSPTAGFTRAAAATLKKEDSLQAVMFAPVEARFVKLRILTTYASQDNGTPGGFAPAASRVKILEGQRAGYSSILARNPDLAALAKGVIPAAPPAAAGPTPAAEGPSACAVPAAGGPKTSAFAQSQNVLVIADLPDAYRTVAWKWSETAKLPDRPVVPGVSFTWMTPSGAAPAQLIAEPKVDTVVFAQACEINDHVSAAFKQALLAWVAAGHKLIIQDSDYCSGGRTPKYPFMPYPFATVNPGAFGAKGEAGVLENSTLASSNPKDPAFIDTDGWKSGPNDLGDSNIVVQWDARWCGAMWAKNRLGKNGFSLAYAHYGRGLMIYDGFDADQYGSKAYQRLVTRELLQPFDADYLPCSQPMGSFVITARPDLKSQPMAAGRTYTYPVSVLGNFGYTGTVALDATVVPADPGVAAKLDKTTADLTKIDESSASLTVTASATASLKSKVVAVRGRDTAGKSNVLCLELPERTTGSVSVVSLLRQDRPDKKPTKNLEIILDASGSMKMLLGAKSRWATAQDVLKDVVSKLPGDFSVGLRAYGHTLPSTDPGTCKDTSLVVPVAPLNPAALLASAAKLAPRGETPLVYSILQTPGDLKQAGGGTVILITDGEESCKGDFAAAAKTLKDAGLNLTLNIVGFTLKNVPAQAQLSGLAESTGGHYYGASSGASLARAVLLAAADRLPYRILDAAGKEVAKGEAGVDKPHELPPGTYRVVVTAADVDMTTPVTIAVGQDVVLRASVKGDKLVVER
jgi:hypothetical protein